ncbi:MAG: hypothetical protein ACFFHV_20020 [Promethearchaeota archaeon]
MMMDQKNSYKMFLIIAVILSIVGVGWLYVKYLSEINESLLTIKGARILAFIILIRVGVLSIMSFYVFHQWFKQEKQFLSDLPFLFGLVFLTLIFGKFLDLLFNLTFFTLNRETTLFLLKIRFFILIMTLFPFLYLSIRMILYYLSLKERFKRLGNQNYQNKLTLFFLALIVSIESIAIILAPNFTVIGILLPCFVIPSLLTIIWLFYFSYKNKALPSVNSKVLTIGFSALLFSQFFRPIAQNIFGETMTYAIIVEGIDFFVFLIIFIGFYLEAY